MIQYVSNNTFVMIHDTQNTLYRISLEATHIIERRHRSGSPSKITPEVKAVVEQQMICDDKTTASQLHQLHPDMVVEKYAL